MVILKLSAKTNILNDNRKTFNHLGSNTQIVAKEKNCLSI